MKNKIVAWGAVIAATAGYAAGVLTAPKSGKQTRNDIAKSASKGRIDAEKQLKKIHSELQDLIKDGDSYSKKLKRDAKKEIQVSLDNAKIAREKAREILSALHHGDADDPNLQAVIDEVKLAKLNLSKFLKKK